MLIDIFLSRHYHAVSLVRRRHFCIGFDLFGFFLGRADLLFGYALAYQDAEQDTESNADDQSHNCGNDRCNDYFCFHIAPPS